MRRGLVGALAATTVLAIGVGTAAPASADSDSRMRFRVVGLVADRAGQAPVVDKDLVNPWGLAVSPAGPLWVANEGTTTSTLYAGGVAGATPTKAALTVAVDGGPPAGQAFNDTTAFVLPASTGGTGRAAFMFSSLGGDITAWNPSLGSRAAVVAHVEGAVFTGLAVAHQSDGTALLLAADFGHGVVRVFDGAFNPVPDGTASFVGAVPGGYAPFNVFTSGTATYVSYAERRSDGRPARGGGHGFVDRFDARGAAPTRIASRGDLSAPWGMAFAPASFGALAGALLVGNFGSGRIAAFRGTTALGLLRGGRGNRGGPLTVDGLWALLPGTANSAGTGALWFSSGPDDERHGLVGEILPG